MGNLLLNYFDRVTLVSLNVGLLGYPDGSVGAAIVAVVLVHVVIVGFVYEAWKEGSTKID